MSNENYPTKLLPSIDSMRQAHKAEEATQSDAVTTTLQSALANCERVSMGGLAYLEIVKSQIREAIRLQQMAVRRSRI